MTLPSTSPSLKNAALSRRGIFTSEIEYLLVRLLSAEVQYHRTLELAKTNIMVRRDFSVSEGFRCIDIRNLSYIDRLSLMNFLRRHRTVSDEDVDAIFRRVDNDGDELIIYQEFVDCIMPSQNLSSRSYRASSPPALYSQTQRSGYESNDFSRTAFRNSSPLRLKSPNRNTLSASSLRFGKTSDISQLPANTSSPLRYSTLRNPIYSSSMRSVQDNQPRHSSPLRNSLYKNQSPRGNSPRNSSPLRNPAATSRNFSLRDSLYKNPSPQRTAEIENASKSFSKSFSNTNLQSRSNIQGSLRKSSPLRRSSPERPNLTESRGFNASRTGEFNSSRPGEFNSSRTGGFKSSKNGEFNTSRSLRLPDPLTTPIEEKELVTWFQDEIKISREIERKKNELALKHDFNLIDAFRMFDKNDLGMITINDLEITLGFFAFYAPSDELYLLLKHFSHFQNSRLHFSDFSEMFSSSQEEYARILRNRPSINAEGADRLMVFTRETQSLFFDTFRLLLNAESLAERVRQRLSRLPQFNIHQAFVAVDKDRNGFITIDEFQSILHSHGIFATSKDLQTLMQKYDKNKDGRVSYSEFVEEVTPKSPRRY